MTIQEAMKSKDKYHLGKVINECLASGTPELKDDIQRARKTLNILEGGTGGSMCLKFQNIRNFYYEVRQKEKKIIKNNRKISSYLRKMKFLCI